MLPRPIDILRSAIGRPRTALVLSEDPRIAQLAREGGATVTESAEGEARDFDLVYVEKASMAQLRALSPRLGDGGHLVMGLSPGERPEALAGAVRDVGLEPLWRQNGRLAKKPILVARRRPIAKKLSLTVGMISMNEAGAVGGVIDAIRKYQPDCQILLVDSSKDDTPRIAESKGARVLRQFPPRGYGPAMTRLLYSADTDVIVTMDCDGTYPAQCIGELHRRIEAGADLVNTSRTHHRPKTMPFPNYVANRVFAGVASVVHRFSTTDVHSGMRAYRTSMLRGIHVAEKGAALPVELLIVPARRGYRVENVDIDYFQRIGDSTLQRWDSTLWTFRRIGRPLFAGTALR